MRLKCAVHLVPDRNGLIVAVARNVFTPSLKHVSAADVIFITEDRPHETFRREGSDLLMTVDIFLREALTGTVVTVNTLDDRTLRIPITSVITYVVASAAPTAHKYNVVQVWDRFLAPCFLSAEFSSSSSVSSACMRFRSILTPFLDGPFIEICRLFGD